PPLGPGHGALGPERLARERLAAVGLCHWSIGARFHGEGQARPPHPRASVGGTVSWWMWFVAGVGLLIVELVTPGGFFAVFFGVAAMVVGLLTVAHLAGPEWLQWALFSLLSVIGVLVFRRPVMQRFGLSTPILPSEEMKGEWALVTEEVRPGELGKVELRGTSWSARANRAVRVGGRAPSEV